MLKSKSKAAPLRANADAVNSAAKVEPGLAHTVHTALHQSPYLSAHKFQVEAGDGHVRLHGEVGSYYEKQMAQETVLRVDGVERIENLLQVAW